MLARSDFPVHVPGVLAFETALLVVLVAVAGCDVLVFGSLTWRSEVK